LAFFQAQVFGNPFYIGCFKPGRVILAASGALQAVIFFKRFCMQLRQPVQQGPFIGPLQELPEHFLAFHPFLYASPFCHGAKNRNKKQGAAASMRI
jgi:hypothetical protein